MNLKSLRLIFIILLLVFHCKKVQAFFEEEKVPDITNPKMIKQDLFELKYPSNWVYQEDLERQNKELLQTQSKTVIEKKKRTGKIKR